MSAASEIYDFETVIPAGVVSLISATGLTARYIADDPEFQSVRPRAEVTYSHEGENAPRVVDPVSGRSCAFRGTLNIYLITDADATGKAAHNGYRADIRNILATLPTRMNETILTKHSIAFANVATEKHGVRQKDGFAQTQFSCPLMVTVQADAWATLT